MVRSIISASLIAASVAAFAQATDKPGVGSGMNTLYGPTGLLTVPTSSTVRLREAKIGATFANDVRSPSINYGVIDWVEIGGAFVDRDNGSDRLIGNAKVTFIPSNFRTVTLGVGVIDAADAIGRTFYAVASADLLTPNAEIEGRSAVGFRVHAGYGSGMFREKLIGGAELYFQEGFSLLGEYDGKNVNGGVRYTKDSVQAQLGVLNKKLAFGISTTLRF